MDPLAQRYVSKQVQPLGRLLTIFVAATRAVDAAFLLRTVLKEECSPWKYQML